MKETKYLYGRLTVLVKPNRDVDQKEAIGNYKFFTLASIALFAPVGSVLPCIDKSKLISFRSWRQRKQHCIGHRMNKTIPARGWRW